MISPRTLPIAFASICLTSLAACDRPSTAYDPAIDGVAPRVAYVDVDNAGMPNILKDPKTVRSITGGTAGGGGSTPRSTTPTSGRGPQAEKPIAPPDTAPPIPIPPDIGG